MATTTKQKAPATKNAGTSSAAGKGAATKGEAGKRPSAARKSKRAAREPKADVFADTTNAVIAAIEAGAAEWKMPWNGFGTALAHNPTKKGRPAYRGGNAIVLWVVAEMRGFETGEWATYRQWESIGAQVRKGEKGTAAIYYSRREVADDAAPDGVRRLFFANRFTLFNAAQVDGYEPAAPVLNSDDQIVRADAFFVAVGANVVHRNEGRAYYRRAGDQIVLPPFAHFTDAPAYYATSAHEHAHWTGHESRLDRTYGDRFGDDAYAVEELTAELSAAFTCAALGITPTPRPDHAAYLSHWLKVLRADTRALYAIASKAQAATDFLLAAGGMTVAAADPAAETVDGVDESTGLDQFETTATASATA